MIKFDGKKIAEDVTWGDLEILEGGTHKSSIEVLSRFMLDESGKPLTQAKAREVLRKLKPREAGQVITDFYKALREGAINPPTADS